MVHSYETNHSSQPHQVCKALQNGMYWWLTIESQYLNYLIKGWPEIRPISWSASWCDMWGWDGGVRNIIRPMTSAGSPQGPSGSRGTQLFPREMAPSLQLAPKVERMHPYGKFNWFQICKSLFPLGTAESHITQQMPEGIWHSTCLCLVKTGQARPDYQEWGQDGAQIWLHPLRGRHLSPGGLWTLPASQQPEALWSPGYLNESSRGTVEFRRNCGLFIGGTDAEAEAPILWPSDSNNWLIGKDPDAGKRLKAGGKGDDRGRDGWVASLTQWA